MSATGQQGAAAVGQNEGKAVVGNLPAASVATNRELTTREQNLYGEKYPAATLKDLGVSTKPKAKAKAKGKAAK